MDSGIALLLGGSCADLSAILHAIELAKRTTGIVHVVFMDGNEAEEGPGPGGKAHKTRRDNADQLLALASWLWDVEAVAIHVHRLDSMADGLVARFIGTYHIFCLMVGAGDRSIAKRHAGWIEKLRRRMADESGGLSPSLWSVVIEPQDDPLVEGMLSGLQQAAWSTTAIHALTDRLRTALKRADPIPFKASERRKKCTCTFR